MRLRRITGILLAIVLCVALGTISVAAAPARAYTLVDIVTVAKSIAGQVALTPEETVEFDANDDGVVTIADLVVIAESVLLNTMNTPTTQQPAAQPTVCPTCAHYPCICSQQVAPMPTVCPGCNQYPCVCNVTSPSVCANCGQYPCVCGVPSVPTTGNQSYVCGNCHRNPCICSTGNHHNYGHGHHGWSHC